MGSIKWTKGLMSFPNLIFNYVLHLFEWLNIFFGIATSHNYINIKPQWYLLYSILQHHKTLIFTRGSNISIYFYESLRKLKNNDFFNISSLFLAEIDEEACFQYEGRHQKFLLPKPASQSQYKKVKVTWWQTRSTDVWKISLYCAFHKHANSKVQKPPSQLRFSLPSIIITITCNEPWNTETRKTDWNPPITNHKPWPFEPV